MESLWVFEGPGAAGSPSDFQAEAVKLLSIPKSGASCCNQDADQLLVLCRLTTGGAEEGSTAANDG